MEDECDALSLNASCLVCVKRLDLLDHTSSVRPVTVTLAGSVLGAYSWKSTEVLWVLHTTYNTNPPTTAAPKLSVERTTSKIAFLYDNFSFAIGLLYRGPHITKITKELPAGGFCYTSVMLDIPFGKFFDTQADKDFINAFEEVSYSDDDVEDTYYLLKNTFDNNYYAVVSYGNGGPGWRAFDAWVSKQLQEKLYKRDEIHPKNPDWYADYSIFRIDYEK